MLDIHYLEEKGGTFRDLNSGEVIFNQGTAAVFYHQLISGRVRWATLHDNGKEVLHSIVEPGESFGDLPVFDKGLYSASAIADTPAKLIRIRIETFHEILEEKPELFAKFTQLFVARLRFHFFLTQTLSTNSPEYILKTLIDHFNKERKYVCQECKRLLLTRQQLANITGLRVETVIRTIKCLEKDSHLAVIRGKVFVSSDEL